MRCFTAVTLLIAGVALPVFAQRGGARGGFSGHSAPGFHSGFTGPTPNHFSGPGFAAPPRFSAGPSFRMTPSYPRAGFGATNARPAYSSSGGYHRTVTYRRVVTFHNGVRFVSLVPVWGWSPWSWSPFWGFPNTFGFDDPPASANSAAQADDVQPVEQYELPSGNPSKASPAIPPENEEAVKLVFKDRRPAQEIHNYALTPTTLYVLDQHRRDIPIAEIDLAATEKVNRDAGVNFQLPAALR